MEYSSVYLKYENLLISLKDIIALSEERILREEPDRLFADNVNFFIKSYLINICTYLEAYLQDICFSKIENINNRLINAKIPHNFLYWRISKDVKEKELNFSIGNYQMTKKEIGDELSGNPYKTIKMFRLLGINLEKERCFQGHKDMINSVVSKRNSIIHHNDNAIDVSFLDLYVYVDNFIEYMRCIDSVINLNF